MPRHDGSRRKGMQSPRQVRRLYGFLTAADYCAEFLFGITGTLYFLSRGLHPVDIGLMLAFFWWSEALFQIPSGILADVVGRKPAVVIGYLTRACGYLLVALLPNLAVGIVGFGIVGLGSTFTGGAAEAWAIDEIEASAGRPADLDRFFSISKVAENTGMLLGSIAGGIIGGASLAAPFYLTVVFFLGTGVVALVAMRESRPVVRCVRGVWRGCARVVADAVGIVRRDPGLSTLMTVAAVPRMLGAAPGMQWNVYLSTYVGGRLVYLGATRSAACLCGLLCAAVLVPLTTRGVSRSVLVGIASITGGCALALAARVPSLVTAVFGYVMYTASRSTAGPSVMAALAGRMGSSARATMISCYTAAAGLANGTGYLLFSALIHNLAVIRTSWTVTGLLTALTALPLVKLLAPDRGMAPSFAEPQDGQA